MAAQRKAASMAQQNGRLGEPKPDDEAKMEADAPRESAPTRRPTARDRAHASGYEAAQPSPSRRPSSERENAFNAMAWMLEGATGLLEEFRHNDLGLSEEFWVHASAARREGLLAMRAAIDSLLEKTDAAEAALQEQQQRRERRGGIDIDF
jgi:hypothetical protein